MQMFIVTIMSMNIKDIVMKISTIALEIAVNKTIL